MDRSARRARLAQRLPELEADAFLVTRLPNVRYLSGFSGTNGQLIVTETSARFLTDGRYAEAARHEVPDLPHTIYSGDVTAAVGAACRELGPRPIAFEADGLTYRSWATLRDGSLDLVPASGAVEDLRLQKDADEVALIAAAQAIADDAFEAITGKLAEGLTERQVAFELDTFMRQRTPDGVAFDTILAFGENAAQPHHHPTDRPLARGDVVKMDFGSVVQGYHSDMTRTVAFGDLSDRLREVYDVVRRAQQAGVDVVRAGVTGGEVDAVVRAQIADAGYGQHFPHGLGHGVGLEIHEGPWLRPGSGQSIPDGAVVTIEPGVYLPGVGGVRIEDMVEVTTTGRRVIPRTPKDLVIL
jgi:Xaa-Pro aminopeptidase